MTAKLIRTTWSQDDPHGSAGPSPHCASPVSALMLEDVAVEDRGGALHLSGLLPAARLQAVADLPPIAATREAVIAGHLACAQLFIPIARDLSDKAGVQWPAELERAVREHLHRSLSLEFA